MRSESHKLSSATSNQRRSVVKVERRFTHPLLKKRCGSKNYHAHDETKAHKLGHSVDRGDEPISKLKR